MKTETTTAVPGTEAKAFQAMSSHGEVVAISEASAILSTINKMANRKDIEPQRLGQMIDLYERIQAIHAKSAFASAMAEMQPKLPIIDENGTILNKNGKVQSTYAYFEDIWEAVVPILSEHGFWATFKPELEGDKPSVTCIITHREGHTGIEAKLPLPVDENQYRNAVQNIASTLSYGKRYSLQMALGLTSRGEDDDGVKGGATYINNERRDELSKLIREIGEITGKNEFEIFCTWAKVPSVAELPAKNYEKAKHALETKWLTAKKGAEAGA